MESTLDDIGFLANSENRVAVLEALVGVSLSRDEIRDRVDASRVTIARILRELEARTWIERAGQEYRATPLGEWVFEEFSRLVENVEAQRRLREPLQYIPPDLLTFDVRCLRDAELILPNGCDATALIRRIVEFHRSGERIRGIARTVAPVIIDNQWELTVQGNTRLELGITPDVLETIRSHPASARQFREMLDEEYVQFFVSDEIPISVGIVDDTVGINLTDEQGMLKGRVKTDNETVYAWAVDLFETYREQGRPVKREVVPA